MSGQLNSFPKALQLGILKVNVLAKSQKVGGRSVLWPCHEVRQLLGDSDPDGVRILIACLKYAHPIARS